jgi:hypothetical protein
VSAKSELLLAQELVCFSHTKFESLIHRVNFAPTFATLCGAQFMNSAFVSAALCSELRPGTKQFMKILFYRSFANTYILATKHTASFFGQILIS